MHQKEILLVIMFLSRKKFHAKQILCLAASIELGPGVVDQQSVGFSPGLVLVLVLHKILDHSCFVFPMGY